MVTLQKFRDTPEDKAAYLARLEKGEGFVANCCSGYPRGYMLHRASCNTLDANKDRNPLRGTTGKIWAATWEELESYGEGALARCSRCFQGPKVPEEYDTDMERESHLVVPGGQIESDRSRH